MTATQRLRGVARIRFAVATLLFALPALFSSTFAMASGGRQATENEMAVASASAQPPFVPDAEAVLEALLAVRRIIDASKPRTVPPQPLANDECGAVRTLRVNVTRTAEISNCRRSIRYRFDDLRIVVRQRPSRDLEAAEVVVERIGYPRQRLYPVPFPWGIHVTVGHLDRSAARYVMIQAFSGGFHCCRNTYVVVPDGPNRGTFPIASFEAGTEMADASTDVDGDGIVDFVGRDTRFFYAFTSYSSTGNPPPWIWNIRNGRLVDVSGEPRYRSLFEEPAAELRRQCLGSNHDYFAVRGVCPQYVAAAARIGQFAQAWRDMLSVYTLEQRPSGCETWNRGGLICSDFPTHLLHFLREKGYLTERDLRHAIPPIRVARSVGTAEAAFVAPAGLGSSAAKFPSEACSSPPEDDPALRWCD